jgi:hypothetical protein
LVTTEAAATTAPSPIVTPFKTIARAPIQMWSPISIGAAIGPVEGAIASE